MAVKIALTARDEDILRAVHYYRYMTARDLTNLLFAKTSITHMREVLAELCGKEDLQTHSYLCRFTLPSPDGRRERVYVLGSRGKKLLQGLGIPATWYFRPHKLKFLSYSYVIHNLILTRTMVAAACWAKTHPAIRLVDKRICYELSGKVIPDGWLQFEERTAQRVYEQPIIIELDRGMEYKNKFRDHVRGRINYIQSGEYKKTFNTDVASIAYVTTGQTPEYRVTRQKTMCSWIAELLKDMRMEDWAGVFRVASVEFQTLYENALFEDAVWYTPDSPKPLSLFDQ